MKALVVLLSPALLILLCSAGAVASAPGKHPYYLRALSDLRSAHALIRNSPGDLAVHDRESVAMSEISDAINDIRQGAIDDGRAIADHQPADMPSDHSGALHEAEELLTTARTDVQKDEDDKASQGLQRRTLAHLDRAHAAIEEAISSVQEGR